MLFPIFFFAGALSVITIGFGLNFLYLGYFRQSETAGLEYLVKGSGYFMLLFGITLTLTQPFWIEKRPVPQSEYTVEKTETETIFRHGGLEISTDKLYWANMADNPEKYCVYKSYSYNLFGMWKGEGMLGLSSNPPCEPIDKYEF